MSCALRKLGEEPNVRVIDHEGLVVDERVLARDLESQGLTESLKEFREMIRSIDSSIL
jgi:hypothetical protein